MGDEGVEPTTLRCKRSVMPFHQSPDWPGVAAMAGDRVVQQGCPDSQGECDQDTPAPQAERVKPPRRQAEEACEIENYIENELPQPQVLLALGLLMLKPR